VPLGAGHDDPPFGLCLEVRRQNLHAMLVEGALNLSARVRPPVGFSRKTYQY